MMNTSDFSKTAWRKISLAFPARETFPIAIMVIEVRVIAMILLKKTGKFPVFPLLVCQGFDAK